MASGASDWTVQTTGPLDTAPVVGSDGSVYCFNRMGDLYRLVNGVPVWHERLHGGGDGSLSIGVDGTLYVATGTDYGVAIIAQQPYSYCNFTDARVVCGQSLSSADYIFADNGLWVLRNGNSAGDTPPILVNFTSTTAAADASFSIRLNASASYAALDQIVEAQNVNTGGWEVIDQRPSTTSESTVLVTVSTDPGRFVDPSTGRIQIRAGWRPTRVLPTTSWVARIDQVRLESILPPFQW